LNKQTKKRGGFFAEKVVSQDLKKRNRK